MKNSLKKLLKDWCIVDLHESIRGHFCRVEEPQNIEVKRLDITNVNDGDEEIFMSFDAVARRNIQYTVYSPFLRLDGNRAINKRSDLIVFKKIDNQWNLILLELKSGNHDSNEVYPQLKATRHFLNYLGLLLKEEHGCNELFNLSPKNIKYICIHKKDQNKTAHNTNKTKQPNKKGDEKNQQKIAKGNPLLSTQKGSLNPLTPSFNFCQKAGVKILKIGFAYTPKRTSQSIRLDKMLSILQYT